MNENTNPMDEIEQINKELKEMDSRAIRFSKRVGICILAVFIGWAALVLIGTLTNTVKVGDTGAFGDSFAPFVGLTSIGVLALAIYSSFLQRIELRAQRKVIGLQIREMIENRREFEGQKQALLDSAETQRNNLLLAAYSNLLSVVSDREVLRELNADNTEAGVNMIKAVRSQGRASARKLLELLKEIEKNNE